MHIPVLFTQYYLLPMAITSSDLNRGAKVYKSSWNIFTNSTESEMLEENKYDSLHPWRWSTYTHFYVPHH